MSTNKTLSFNENPVILALKWAVYFHIPGKTSRDSTWESDWVLYDSKDDARQSFENSPYSHRYSVHEVCICEKPSEQRKSTMTFDQFFSEAARTGMTADDLIPGVMLKLDQMEEGGIIRKHADGGHELVTPANEDPTPLTIHPWLRLTMTQFASVLNNLSDSRNSELDEDDLTLLDGCHTEFKRALAGMESAPATPEGTEKERIREVFELNPSNHGYIRTQGGEQDYQDAITQAKWEGFLMAHAMGKNIRPKG